MGIGFLDLVRDGLGFIESFLLEMCSTNLEIIMKNIFAFLYDIYKY